MINTKIVITPIFVGYLRVCVVFTDLRGTSKVENAEICVEYIMSITTIGGYAESYPAFTLYSFTINTPNNTITFPSDTIAEVLIVGGGGGGGGPYYNGDKNEGSGGGGGGEVAFGRLTFSAGEYSIMVGSGGSGGIGIGRDTDPTKPIFSTNGEDTIITGPNINIRAKGGGRGGDVDSVNQHGGDGGSGGGGNGAYTHDSGRYASGGKSIKGSDTLTRYGNPGGTGKHEGSGGGGGGALTPGTAGEKLKAGNGGDGYLYTLYEVDLGRFGAGGGGGLVGTDYTPQNAVTVPGNGGNGGGGKGGFISSRTPYYTILATSGENHTGSGGGGALGDKMHYGGAGGSGIVFIAILTIQPILYYPFDVDILNYASGNGVSDTITPSGCSIVSTHTINSSGSLFFNGVVNQKFSINSTLTLENTGLTISCWVKFAKIPTFGSFPNFRIFQFDTTARNSGSGDNNIVLYYYNTAGDANRLDVKIRDISKDVKLHDDNITMTDNNWHHYCLTISPNTGASSNVNLYLDNVNVLNTTITSANYPSLTFTNCLIGQSSYSEDYTADNQAEFYVNNFMMYNRVITAVERFDMYAPIASAKMPYTVGLNTLGLLKYYPLDNMDGLNNYATGTSNADILTATNTDFVSGDAPYNKGGSYLTGVTGYLSAQSGLVFRKSGITISVWMRHKTRTDNANVDDFDNAIVFDFSGSGLTSSGSTNYSKINLFWKKESATPLRQTLELLLSEPDNANYTYIYRDIIPDFNWHHYCVTINTTTNQVSLYLDGLLQGYNGSSVFVPYNESINSVVLGKSSGSSPVYSNAYYSSFMIFNRCINFSEIGTLMSLKNTVLNGEFNSFATTSPGSKNYTVASITNYPTTTTNFVVANGADTVITSSSFTTTSGLKNRISGWKLTGLTLSTAYYFIINGNSEYINGSTANGVLNTTLKTNPQQYTFVVRSAPDDGQISSFICYLTQNIYFTQGTYILKYKAAGRSDGKYDTAHTLTSSIPNIPNILSASSTTPLSTSVWTPYNMEFTVITPCVYTLTFTYDFSTWTQSSTRDSSILLTEVEIIPVVSSYYDATAGMINKRVSAISMQCGLGGFTNLKSNPSRLLTYKYNNVPIFDTAPLYMHGTCVPTNFLINGVDVGYYFQQLSPFDGSYGYCFATNAMSSIRQAGFESTFSNKYDSTPQYIWPENNTTGQGIDIGVAYWLYYTFYYDGNANIGIMNAAVDDEAVVYFNNIKISDVPRKTYENLAVLTDASMDVSINIVNGLNYIRVAVYNVIAGETGMSAFIATFRDVSNNIVAVTNQLWTWSATPANYANATNYMAFGGSLVAQNRIFNEPHLTIANASYYKYMDNTYTYYVITRTVSNSSVIFNTNSSVNYIVVGGGGGGGSSSWTEQGGGSGGGGGGIAYGLIEPLRNKPYTIKVGFGGPTATSGSSSSFSLITQITQTIADASGGAGGTGGENKSEDGGLGGTSSGVISSVKLVGGKGGKNEKSGEQAPTSGEDSSDVLPFSVVINDTTYARLGGGGGGGYDTGSTTIGGIGGAGGGARNTNAPLAPPNTGGGGGGGGVSYVNINRIGSPGSDGVIVFRIAHSIRKVTTTSPVVIDGGKTIKRILLVGGGAGGGTGSTTMYPGNGGEVIVKSDLNISTSNTTFSVTIGNGGQAGVSGGNTTFSYNGTTYTALGGTVAAGKVSLPGTDFDGLYYGGSGAAGGEIYVDNPSDAPLGGGGGGGGISAYITNVQSGASGSKGGGISSELLGGDGGAGGKGLSGSTTDSAVNGSDGRSSPYGGGGGGGGGNSYYTSPYDFTPELKNVGTAGDGGAGSGTDLGGGGGGIGGVGAVGGGGGGGNGGVNTGGGGGGGAKGLNINGTSGSGGSGVVIIYYV